MTTATLMMKNIGDDSLHFRDSESIVIMVGSVVAYMTWQ